MVRQILILIVCLRCLRWFIRLPSWIRTNYYQGLNFCRLGWSFRLCSRLMRRCCLICLSRWLGVRMRILVFLCLFCLQFCSSLLWVRSVRRFWWTFGLLKNKHSSRCWSSIAKHVVICLLVRCVVWIIKIKWRKWQLMTQLMRRWGFCFI